MAACFIDPRNTAAASRPGLAATAAPLSPAEWMDDISLIRPHSSMPVTLNVTDFIGFQLFVRVLFIPQLDFPLYVKLDVFHWMILRYAFQCPLRVFPYYGILEFMGFSQFGRFVVAIYKYICFIFFSLFFIFLCIYVINYL